MHHAFKKSTCHLLLNSARHHRKQYSHYWCEIAIALEIGNSLVSINLLALITLVMVGKIMSTQQRHLVSFVMRK